MVKEQTGKGRVVGVAGLAGRPFNRNGLQQVSGLGFQDLRVISEHASRDPRHDVILLSRNHQKKGRIPVMEVDTQAGLSSCIVPCHASRAVSARKGACTGPQRRRIIAQNSTVVPITWGEMRLPPNFLELSQAAPETMPLSYCNPEANSGASRSRGKGG